MSDTPKRDYSLTVRFSPDERGVLEALAQRFDLDKSSTVRRALVLAAGPSLPESGCFIPLNAGSRVFHVRLRRKDHHAA